MSLLDSTMALLLEEIIRSVEVLLKLKNPNQKPYVDPNLDPVLLVPGIAGSILNAVDHENGNEERVWVRIFGADHEFRTKMWSRFDPSTGKNDSFILIYIWVCVGSISQKLAHKHWD